MIKTYVLDTNILLQTEGNVIFGFADNIVAIPSMVLEELDNQKTAPGEKGYAARECIRKLSEIRDKESGFKNKVSLENGGTLSIEINYNMNYLPIGWDKNKPDNIILGTVKDLIARESEKKRKNKVILVTNDISMQIKASIVGIEVEGYKNEQITSEEFYTGRKELFIPDELINKLYREEFLDVEELKNIKDVELPHIYNNSFYVLKGYSGSSALAVYEKDKIRLIKSNLLENISGISPKNAGQTFSLYALLKSVDELPFVLLKGCAGCGKTLIALAAGLQQMEKGMYDKIIITRSNTLADEELGFLPGTLEEKMGPLVSPFIDNLRFLYKMMGEDDEQITYMIDDMLERGSLEIVSLAYIRGRSIPNAYIIIDESQNLSITQAKTIVTRVGIGSKIVMLGDIGQIDNHKLDKKSNGMSYLSDKFHKADSKMCAQLEYLPNESVRSQIAAEAIRILEN